MKWGFEGVNPKKKVIENDDWRQFEPECPYSWYLKRRTVNLQVYRRLHSAGLKDALPLPTLAQRVTVQW